MFLYTTIWGFGDENWDMIKAGSYPLLLFQKRAFFAGFQMNYGEYKRLI